MVMTRWESFCDHLYAYRNPIKLLVIDGVIYLIFGPNLDCAPRRCALPDDITEFQKWVFYISLINTQFIMPVWIWLIYFRRKYNDDDYLG